MKNKHIIWILVLLAALAVSCGADDDSSSADDDDETADDDAADDDTADDDASDDDSPEPRAEVTLPDYPYWPNDALQIDEEHLVDLATAYCAEAGAAADDRDFFLGVLPLAAFDRFCDGETAPAVLRGDMYLSGYFGGLWLRDELFRAEEKAGDYPLLKPLFNWLTARLGDLDLLLSAGETQAIIDRARGGLPLWLIGFGYNRGYLDEVYVNPPAGFGPPELNMDCADDLALDCTSPDVALTVLDNYRAALPLLRDPPNDVWAEMADLARLAELGIGSGELVWSTIPTERMDEPEYQQMIDLSVGFLLVLEAVTLGQMTAWAEESVDDGACALLLESGAVTWTFSYMMGVSSFAPPGLFPHVTCPE